MPFGRRLQFGIAFHPAFEKLLSILRAGIEHMAKFLEKPYCVLIADDSELDRLVLSHFLRESKSVGAVHEVENGVEAIAYLRGDGIYADRERHPFPDLALIDLKMPKRDGFEVLEWLQTQAFKKLMVVVLSGSNLPGEREKALGLGAHHHETKPFENNRRRILVARLEAYLGQSHAAPLSEPD